MKQATLESMPTELKEAYVKVAPHPEQPATFHEKSVKRMLEFRDWRPDVLRSIDAPTMIIVADRDIVRPEQAVEMFRLLPNAQLAVLPGTDHMTLVQRADWQVSMIEASLDGPPPDARRIGEKEDGLPNGAGSEVLLTLFRLPDMSDARYAEDQRLVERDLQTLKGLLER